MRKDRIFLRYEVMKHDLLHLKADYVQGEIMLILILRR